MQAIGYQKVAHSLHMSENSLTLVLQNKENSNTWQR